MTLSIACPEGTVQGGGVQDRALGVLAAFRRELYRCFSKRPDGWLSWPMRCCASRTGCICWPNCRWYRSAAVATARSMTR